LSLIQLIAGENGLINGRRYDCWGIGNHFDEEKWFFFEGNLEQRERK